MPEVLAPPKPSTPAPAPSPTPPAPTPPPVPAPSRADDPFADLHTSIKPPPPAAPPAPEPQKGDKSTPAKPAPAAPPAKAPVREPKALREELDRVNAALEAKNKAQAEAERRLQEAEARGKDTSALVEQMTARDKQIEQLQAELRAAKQETSPEFKKEYDEPFNDVAELARQDIEAMQSGEWRVDETTGEKQWHPTAQATYADLEALWLTYKVSVVKGKAEARKLLGENSDIIVNHLEQLRLLDRKRAKALEQEKANFKVREEQDRAKEVTERQARTDIIARVRQELAESVDDYRDPPEDKELSDLRSNGYKMFDVKPQNFQQFAYKMEHIRHIFAAHGPNKLKLLRLEKERDDLKSKVEELEGKKPSGGKRVGGEAGKPADEPWEITARRELLGTS